MSDKYNQVPEELWRRLIAADAPKSGVDFSQPFPYDQYAASWPRIKDLVRDIEAEYNYEMSEMQGSWAVNAYLRWDYDEYAAECLKGVHP